jgi:hypothetical protein
MKAAAGLCFGFAKRSVNCADSVLNNIRLAFAGAFAQWITKDNKLSAAAVWPSRPFRLSRHRDPAPVGVCRGVRVESSPLHSSGTDEWSNEGTFRFRPASCEQRRKHPDDPFFPCLCQIASQANWYLLGHLQQQTLSASLRESLELP